VRRSRGCCLTVVAVQMGLQNRSPSSSQATVAEDEAGVLQKQRRRSDLQICGCHSWSICYFWFLCLLLIAYSRSLFD
jgi:hypothetical protein